MNDDKLMPLLLLSTGILISIGCIGLIVLGYWIYGLL